MDEFDREYDDMFADEMENDPAETDFGDFDGFRDRNTELEDWDGGYDDDEAYDNADEDSEPYGMTDVEADADTLASAGWGTDEDYGYFGGGEDW